MDHFLSLRCSLFRIHLIYEHLYFLRLLAADILPGEQAGHEGRQAAGDLFGIELFQQRAVRDVGGDDGGQVCPQPVVEQTVQGAQEEVGIELGAQVVQNEQVGPGCGLQQGLFLAAGVCAKVQCFQLGEKSGLDT